MDYGRIRNLIEHFSPGTKLKCIAKLTHTAYRPDASAYVLWCNPKTLPILHILQQLYQHVRL